MVVGGLLDQGRPAAARGRRGARTAERSSPQVYRQDAATHGPTRIDQQFEPPGVAWDDETYKGDAYPLRLGCVRRLGRGRPRHRRGHGPRRRRHATWAGHPPGACKGQIEGGTLQAIGWATVEEISWGRPLPERPARDIHHPDVARRAPVHVDPGRGAVRRRAARRQGHRRAADGRRRAGGRRGDRPRDRSLGPRAARHAGAAPRGMGARADRGPGRVDADDDVA